MKKLLFVVDERCMGGVSILLEDIFNMIDRKNLNIDLLILHDRGDMLKNLPSDINIILGTNYFSTVDLDIKTVLKSKNILTIFNKLRLIFDLKTGLIEKKIKKERQKMNLGHYDIEIAFKDGFTALFTAFGDSDIKYHWIQYDYGVNNPNARYAKLFKKILPTFNKIISVSDGIKKDFNKIYNLGNKVSVIDNLINISRIKNKSEEEVTINLNKKNLNIVCVGRLVNFHKGFDRIINVISRLKEEGFADNLNLHIYGDGPDYQTLHNQINYLNLENNVLLCGRVNNPYKYIKNYDLFVLPSRYEAFGLVIVEALTLGVPVVVTKNNATKKLVDKKYGIIVDNSEEGLYKGLKRLILDNKTLKSYKKNLKKYQYDNESIIEKLNSLFR